MEAQLEYTGSGRSEFVIYRDDLADIKMYSELGGGECVAIITIPREDEWKDKTGRPVESRDQIINFTAQQIIKDQAPNAYYKLSDNSITVWQKDNGNDKE